MSRNHHDGGGGKELPFFFIFSSFVLFVPIPIWCIQRQKVFSLRLPLLHLWVIEKVAEQEEPFCDIAVSIFFTGLPLLKPRIILMFNHIRNWMKNTIMWVNTPVPSGKKLKKIPQQVDLLSKWEIGLRNEYIILGKSHNPHYCLIPCCARRAKSVHRYQSVVLHIRYEPQNQQIKCISEWLWITF